MVPRVYPSMGQNLIPVVITVLAYCCYFGATRMQTAAKRFSPKYGSTFGTLPVNTINERLRRLITGGPKLRIDN